MGKIFDAMEKSGRDDLPAGEPEPRTSAPPPPLPDHGSDPGDRHGGLTTGDSGGSVPEPPTPGPLPDRDDPFLDFVRRETPPAVETPMVRGGDLPDRLSSSIVAALDPQSVEAEQFRLLKNNILFPEKGVPPRSIMITSPSPNEGKSFVSANLAVSIAQSID
ncbi:MAG: hypothetical protein V6Z89_24860, partial [Desulfobacter sp.]